MRALVLGAGIAGLATAYALRREAARNGKPLEITILEASGRPGGRIRTEEDAGHRIEWGANAVQGLDGAASRLVDELGLAPERVIARPESARRYIAKRGALHLVPMDPGSLLRFGALSTRGRLRVLAEPFFARRRAADETVLSFAERHVGREAAVTLVGAAVRGIFAGEADRLSLEAAFPLMREMERKHRSLVVAMIRRGKSPGRTTLWSLRRGMGDLVDALTRSLEPAVRLRAPALTIERTDAADAAGAGMNLEWAGAAPRWRVRLASGEQIEADLLLLATPPKVTAALLRGLDAELARALADIASAGLAVVAMSFRPEVFQRAPDGYGFLVPPGEPLEILGALFETNLWPERAPEGRVLIRAMVGGAGRPELLTRTDAQLAALVMKALDTTLGLKGGPERTWVIRQEEAIPQYAVGHRKLLADLGTRLQALPGIHLAGNAYRGVSVASITEDAERTAVRMAAELR
jgi:oxygen-dependent protoporphyrinogen oxidase